MLICFLNYLYSVDHCSDEACTETLPCMDIGQKTIIINIICILVCIILVETNLGDQIILNLKKIKV